MRFVLPVALAIVAGCTQSDAQSQRGQRGPTQVGFVVVQPDLGSGPVTARRAHGRLRDCSEVRPQVNGLIRRRLFTEGAYVRAGSAALPDRSQPLPSRGQPGRRPTSPARARRADAAQVRANRYRPLAEMEAVSKQDYTDAAAAGAAGRGQRRRRTAPRSRPRGSTSATPASRRRSAGGSAVRCRPWARWSAPTRPIRWR